MYPMYRVTGRIDYPLSMTHASGTKVRAENNHRHFVRTTETRIKITEKQQKTPTNTFKLAERTLDRGALLKPKLQFD